MSKERSSAAGEIGTIQQPSTGHDASLAIVNGGVVGSLVSCMQRTVNLDLVPGFVKRVIRDEMYRCFEVESTGEVFQHATFADFVRAPIPRGLGTSLESVARLCRDDPEALDLIDQATRGQHGGDRRSPEARAQANGEGKRRAQHGTTRAYALSRLRNERPDLHALVLAGEMSAHAAMIEAGFRKRPSGLEQLKRDWQKATAEERALFLRWAGAPVAPPPAERTQAQRQTVETVAYGVRVTSSGPPPEGQPGTKEWARNSVKWCRENLTDVRKSAIPALQWLNDLYELRAWDVYFDDEPKTWERFAREALGQEPTFLEHLMTGGRVLFGPHAKGP